jgi:hypothetical protein
VQNYLEKYVGRVNCNDSVGTAFLVSKKELLTAYHTVENLEENTALISVELVEISREPLEVRLKDFDESLDIAN